MSFAGGRPEDLGLLLLDLEVMLVMVGFKLLVQWIRLRSI